MVGTQPPAEDGREPVSDHRSACDSTAGMDATEVRSSEASGEKRSIDERGRSRVLEVTEPRFSHLDGYFGLSSMMRHRPIQFHRGTVSDS